MEDYPLFLMGYSSTASILAWTWLGEISTYFSQLCVHDEVNLPSSLSASHLFDAITITIYFQHS
jgi:hypothetical protein